MAKYSLELKLEVVKYVLEEKNSMWEASRKYEISRSSIRGWVYAYESCGIEGISKKHGTYYGQFKIDVVEYMCKNQLSAMKTAAMFGIPSHKSVSDWERIYYEEGREALYRENRGRNGMANKNQNKPRKSNLDKKIKEDLIAENQRLRMEVDYLKKLNALILKKEKSARKIKRK